MLDVLCITLIITFILMLVIGVVYNIPNNYYWSVITTISIITLLSIILSFIDKTKPTAIDVYRNKTTIEVTYRNGIAIDSTVVFKDKK